jgi:proline dehydrogenase
MIDFSNTLVAFRTRNDKELRRAFWLFKMIEHPFMVSVGKNLVKAALFLHLPVKWMIRETVYDHFCGGETMEECESKMAVMKANKVFAILDYGVEGKESEADFDHAFEVALRTIDFAKTRPEIPFTVFKPTGMGRLSLYEKVGNGKTMTAAEQAEWARVVERYDRICQKAVEAKIPLMIDAEETWMQQAADDLVLSMMRKYNREHAWVYNTLQMYRHDRMDYLKALNEMAEKEDFKVGLKIVRGAYMEKERERAEKMGYPSPIHKDKAGTDRDYDLAVDYIVAHLDRFALCAGSHNETSNQKLAELIEKEGISKSDARIYFSQLFGMSDHITFNLADHGYNVVKYLPYGPVKDVMPYLFRRADENTSVAGQTGRELMLLQAERKRRRSA